VASGRVCIRGVAVLVGDKGGTSGVFGVQLQGGGDTGGPSSGVRCVGGGLNAGEGVVIVCLRCQRCGQST